MITILWLGIFQCIFFISLIVSNKERNAASNFLATWFLVFIGHLITIVFVSQGTNNVLIIWVAKTMYLLHGPLLYLYTQKVLSQRQLNPLQYAHLLVFIIPFLVSVFTLTPNNEIVEISLVIVKLSSMTCYAFLTWKFVSKNVNWLKEQTANALILNVKWIKIVALIFVLNMSMGLLYLLIDLLLPGAFLQVIDSLLYDILIVLIGYFGIKRQVIYPTSIVKESNNYSSSPLKATDLGRHAKNIQQFLAESKAFKDPDFDLDQLSKTMDIPRHHLSQVLNKAMGKTFYDLINTMRIDEAKSLILAGNHKHFSIEGLGHEVGFRSKSVFYAHFKKVVGKTPLQFQKMHESSSN